MGDYKRKGKKMCLLRKTSKNCCLVFIFLHYIIYTLLWLLALYLIDLFYLPSNHFVVYFYIILYSQVSMRMKGRLIKKQKH